MKRQRNDSQSDTSVSCSSNYSSSDSGTSLDSSQADSRLGSPPESPRRGRAPRRERRHLESEKRERIFERSDARRSSKYTCNRNERDKSRYSHQANKKGFYAQSEERLPSKPGDYVNGRSSRAGPMKGNSDFNGKSDSERSRVDSRVDIVDRSAGMPKRMNDQPKAHAQRKQDSRSMQNEWHCGSAGSEDAMMTSLRHRTRCYRDRRDSSGSSGDRRNKVGNKSRSEITYTRQDGCKSSGKPSTEPEFNRRRTIREKECDKHEAMTTEETGCSDVKGRLNDVDTSQMEAKNTQSCGEKKEGMVDETGDLKHHDGPLSASNNTVRQKQAAVSHQEGRLTDRKEARRTDRTMQVRIKQLAKWKEHHRTDSTPPPTADQAMLTTETANTIPAKSRDVEGNDDIGVKPQFSDKHNQVVDRSVDITQNHNVEEEKNESEHDPLDEYMSMISQQIKELKDAVPENPQKTRSSNKGRGQVRNPVNPAKKAIIVRTTVNNNNTNTSNRREVKGDIMEQNADALEYSSEEWSDDDVFASRRNKADTINTNHDKIYYRKFKKCFYSEVPEISSMTAEEVSLFRTELDNMQVTGKRCPKPIKSWAQCITYTSVLDVLKRCGMHTPTPIQAQALPIIASGRDMLGIAKTGSGKTLAFVLPMIRHIKAQPPLDPEDGPISIIITPTRELAMQIAKECKRFCRALDVRVVAVFGGTGISEQIADLKRGTEIAVCTPGRMIDMLAANNGKVTNLRRVTYVVIDEADRMFDMGFEPQVNKILECIRPDRQTVMFSATFPRQMEALARRALHRPIEVVVGGKSIVCDAVEQQVFVLNDDQKYLKLLELLGVYQEHGSILVFVHKQEHADELMKNLMNSSYSCMALHGGIDQYDRDSVLSDFKSGALRLLIATSLAARGIDVKDLILVVNYDCPNHYEDYVHRCGRTGRAGRSGVAATFITPNQDKLAGDIIRALELSNCEAPVELRELWEGYKKKMEDQGILKIKSGTGGFGGKGFKFDSEEQAFLDDRKRVQKLMFSASATQDMSDDDEAIDIDNEIDKTMKSKTRVKNQDETDELLIIVTEPVRAKDDKDDGKTNGKLNAEKLAFAKLLAAKIGSTCSRGDVNEIMSSKKQAETTPKYMEDSNAVPVSLAVTGNGSVNHAISRKSLAEQIADKLNNKLNYVPKEKNSESDYTGEHGQQGDVKIYEEELEINDFPQSARWKVTSKETLANISEYAEAAITVRGKYFPSGKQPPPGESRLYLIIESLTERGLQLAKAEIKRLIKEEMMKMQNPALQMVNRGRYKVL